MSGDITLLPKADQEFLLEKGLSADIVRMPTGLNVTIRNFELPERYSPRLVSLLIKLPAGYPAANPDMFWTNPDVRLLNGSFPDRADVHDPEAQGWQRWSRHGGWRPGVDNLRTKIASVCVEFESNNR